MEGEYSQDLHGLDLRSRVRPPTIHCWPPPSLRDKGPDTSRYRGLRRSGLRLDRPFVKGVIVDVRHDLLCLIKRQILKGLREA